MIRPSDSRNDLPRLFLLLPSVQTDVMPPLHLLSVWNPSYADDALDAHASLLLEWRDRHSVGMAQEDQVYVWWGHLRSPSRLEPLPHRREIVALDAQAQAGGETHLYLTDYRSLYVAHVAEVTDENVRDDDGEEGHIPAYYGDRAVELWFRIWDLRRLVASDTLGTIAELRHLRNTRYHHKPVSLYGGMVQLPLVVTRDEEVSWFGGLNLLTDGRLWVERDAELRGETERVGADLRDNLFGPDLWGLMEAATRTFLAAAEAVFRTRREDPRFDFSGPAVGYAKAVEVETNAALFRPLRRALAGKPALEREARLEASRIDLGGNVPHQGLGVLRQLLLHDGVTRGALSRALPNDHRWMTDQLARELERLMDLRNPAAHGAEADRKALLKRREEVLGIGCEGLLAKLLRVKARG